MVESGRGKPGAELGRLLHHFETAPRRSLDEGEHLYNWGQEGSHMFLVLEGLVKSVRCSPLGKPCVLRVDGPGDLLGLSCFHQPRRTETAIAKTQVCVASMPARELRRVLEGEGLESQMYHYLAQRIEVQCSSLEYFVTLNSEHRLGAILLQLAEQFGNERNGLHEIRYSFTQDELAQMVGTTRSRIGFFLSNFERMRMVDRSGKGWLMIDRFALENFLCS